MNWFEEQIRQRRESDNEALSEAYSAVINSVIGEHFSFDATEEALSLILRYYRLPPVNFETDETDPDERLRIVCRMTGLLERPVLLERGWYRVGVGAFLARVKETGDVVAVLPDAFGRYSYFDRAKSKKVALNRRTESLLDEHAICFVKPFPHTELSFLDVIKFGLSSWTLWDHALTHILLGIATLLGLLVPKINYLLYSRVLTESSPTLLISTVIFLISVRLSMLFLSSVQRFHSSRRNLKMTSALKSATLMRVLMLPTSFFREHSSGEIIARMNYMESVCTGFVQAVFSTALSGLFSLAYITQIVHFTPALVWPSLAVVLANVLFSVYITLRQMRYTKRQMELSAENSGKCLSMISGIQKIKMSGSEKRIFSRWVKGFSEETRLLYNPPAFQKYNEAFTLGISLVGQFVMFYLTLGSGIDVAEYYAFQTAYGMVNAAITTLVGVTLQIASLRPGLEMLRPILETVPENFENARELTSLSGAIEMNNVSFRYDESMPNIIDDFSLKIRPGQYVAIVGKTGCGKSTLIRLLLGFEKPQKGAIYYDGVDLNQIDKRALRRKIGTVMQDDKLLCGEIYTNIVICKPTLSIDEAWEAAEVAGIADDIRKMPMGMHTLIADGSGGISGGQRQRLAIARAIAPKPKILIFDEATSALDNITQKRVSEALDSLSCTRIVIAHRLSTIRHCDRILVMDKGKIIEDGSYEQLVAQNGYFAELVARQRLDNEESQG